MDEVCSTVEGAHAYIDDILHASKSSDIHQENLHKLLQRLEIFGLTLKFEKFKFFVSTPKFLGHILDKNGIKPDTEKIKAVNDLKIPTNITEIR